MEKLSKKTRTPESFGILIFALKQLACCFVSFMLSSTRLFECLPSFSVAFAAAVSRKYIFSAIAGGVAGAVVFSDGMLTGIAGGACILTAGIINGSVRSVFSGRELEPIAFLSSLFCCVCTGLAILLSGGFYFEGFLMFLCDGILAGGAAFFYVRSFSVIRTVKSRRFFDQSEIVGLTIPLCAVIMVLSRFSVFVFVPSRVLVLFAVLMISYIFGETAACAAGILCGAALEASTGVTGLACCVSLCGLTAGFFMKKGHIFASLSYVLTSGMFAVISGTAQSGAVFIEAVISAVLFCFIPKKVLKNLRKRFGCRPQISDLSVQRRSGKLKEAARAVSEISPRMEKIQRSESGTSAAKVSGYVKNAVCADCGMNNSCWGNECAETDKLFFETVSFIEKNGTVTPDELPTKLFEKCLRKNMLSASFIQAYTEYFLKNNDKKKSDGFSDTSLILSDFAKMFSAPEKDLGKTAVNAEAVFGKFGTETENVDCRRESGKVMLDVTAKNFDESINITHLTRELSRACGYSFCIPTAVKKKDTVLLTFTQTPLLRLSTGTVQYAADVSGICGDYFVTFEEEGKQYFVLSDGMGTGESAAAQSEATAEIFASLVRSGMSFKCALKTVNTALLKREDTESVSTLDVMRIDLYSGETVFLKAGAAPSYVLRKGKVSRIEEPSLPIGILEDVSFSGRKTVLAEGDAVIMVSDGACSLKDRHIMKNLAEFKSGSAQALAERILTASGQKNDDSTVIAVVF